MLTVRRLRLFLNPEKERLKNTKSNPPGEPQVPLGGDRRPMVKVRKEGAFTEQGP